MLRTASGILQKIQTFLHGLFSPPPPEDGDDLSFLDDLAWLQETERMRQDALLFWSEASLTRAKSLSDLSAPGKFYEKHTTSLPELGILNLNALSGTPVDEKRDRIFEPLQPAAAFPVPDSQQVYPKGTPEDGNGVLKPVRSFIDPLEDLYEPADTGFVPVRAGTSQPYNDLYAVIMRMTMNRKRE
jgi:hypothetical protein